MREISVNDIGKLAVAYNGSHKLLVKIAFVNIDEQLCNVVCPELSKSKTYRAEFRDITLADDIDNKTPELTENLIFNP